MIRKSNATARRIDRREICNCEEYPFPHRPGGGRCTGEEAGDCSDAEHHRIERLLFDREEARWINHDNRRAQ